MKKQNRALLCAITALALAACALEPPTAAPGADSGAALDGNMGRVLISITCPGDSPGPEAAQSAARTLLPSLSVLDYKLEFTRQGESEPALTLNITSATTEQDIDPGDYTLRVTAYDAGTSNALAGGSVPVMVLAGETVDVTVPLTVNMSGSGSLDYTVTFPVEMILIRGLLTLYPLSYSANPTSIDLSAGLSGIKGIPSGYYRIQLSVYSFIGGTGKFAATTGVVHIIDFLETRASYILDIGDFTDSELYVENASQLNSALASIRDASGTAFTILVKEDFSSPSFSLTDPGYSNKTITLRGADGIREISSQEQGRLFYVNKAGLVFKLQDITLKGRADNNTALLAVATDSELIMESDASVTGNQGGGVSVEGGSFTMRDNASVNGNTASSGGGVYVSSSGTFTVSSGAIWGNTASTSGGGVYVNDGTFTMEDGAISGNTASSGGGVYVSSSGTFTVSSGAISRNRAPSGSGVYVSSSGTFIMSGGAISGNTASASAAYSSASSYGGGVYVNGGTFTLSEGEISGNTVSSSSSGYYSSSSSSSSYSFSFSSGGGVYVDGGTFTMSGGKISGNTAFSSSSAYASSPGGYSPFSYSYSYGGGVYIKSGTFTMSEGEISGNTASAASYYSSYSASSPDNSHNSWSYGGGVYLYGGGTLTKTGGLIYGSNGTGTDPDGKDLKNTVLSGAGAQGAAVYYDYYDGRKYRDTTVGPEQNLSTGSNDNWSD